MMQTSLLAKPEFLLVCENNTHLYPPLITVVQGGYLKNHSSILIAKHFFFLGGTPDSFVRPRGGTPL